ncbi:MAG TPA: glutaredoxin family protein [Dissulfurispiraceae bacterium]|nr:glutaredoxin family protein [Dissulfurispiraceae bacterium]
MESQAKKVRLYTLSTCAVCGKVKKFLDEKGIPYELIVVDTLDSGEQWLASKEVKKYNPAASYPTVVIEEVVVGYDEDRLKKSLGL